MPDSIHTTKSAQFFSKARALRQDDIGEFFDQVLQHNNATEVLRTVKRRKSVGRRRLSVSLLVFNFEVEPTFLRGTAHRDTKHGYALLVELPATIAYFKRHSPSPEDFFVDSLAALPYQTVSRLFSNDATEYERVALRNMTVSDYTVHGASFEARDLKVALSSIGLSRSIPRSLRINNVGEVYSLSPTTSRVGKSEGRSELRELLGWCLAVDAEISGFIHVPGFLDSFAEPKSLSDIPDDTLPNGVMFHFEQLEREIVEEQTAELWKRRSNGVEWQVTGPLVRTIFDRFRSVFAVTDLADGTLRIERENGQNFGILKRNKATFTIHSGQLDSFFLKREGDEDENIRRFVNRDQSFVVTFDDPRWAYSSRNVFRDNALLANIPRLMEVFHAEPQLVGVTSEKGEPAAADSEFPNGSVFRCVEDHCANTAALLFCDDLGDEWADHLAVWEGAGQQRISFMHSKHGDVGLSASAFHEVVGQGLKNLGRLRVRREDVVAKLNDKWSTQYRTANGVDTAIARTRSGAGTPDDLADRITSVLASPNAIREVCLVTSFASKAAIEEAFEELAEDELGGRHITQLLWLISAFVAGCQDAGARPKIICRP